MAFTPATYSNAVRAAGWEFFDRLRMSGVGIRGGSFH